MTVAGFLFMIVSVGAVTALFLWCLVRVFRGGRKPDQLAHVEPVEREDLPRR